MKPGFRPILLLCCCLLAALWAAAQEPDVIYYSNIQNVKLNPVGNQLGYPIIRLHGSDQLELRFDDREGGVKSYSYSWELRNADWSPVMLSTMDYVRGFTQQRITTYRNASVALTRYTHYYTSLPDKSSGPSRSGNYLVKVFLNGDPSQVVFTRRVLVVEEKSAVNLQVLQPFNNQLFTTHQKLNFTVSTRNLNLMNAMQQINVCILQNFRWDNKKFGIRPTFIRQNNLEFNAEQDGVFASGKEWRWLDLRSFRLQSDRVDSARYDKTTTTVFVKTDQDRSAQRFVYYRDGNGMYFNETLDGLNPFWQGDYATVHFRYKPPGGMPFRNDLYLFGELTNWGKDTQARMVFNKESGLYETALWLKQGYYFYGFATKEGEGDRAYFNMDRTEGNYWEAENNYTILVYYRPIGGRADELIGYGSVNSLGGRPGVISN